MDTSFLIGTSVGTSVGSSISNKTLIILFIVVFLIAAAAFFFLGSSSKDGFQSAPRYGPAHLTPGAPPLR